MHITLTTEWQRNKIVQGSWKDKQTWQQRMGEWVRETERQTGGERDGERSPAVPAERGSRWFWMSFRGKLQLKPLAWTVHTQMPSPTAHTMKHETTLRCLVTGKRTASTVWGFVSRMQMLFYMQYPPILWRKYSHIVLSVFPSWYWNYKLNLVHVNKWFPLQKCSYKLLAVTKCSYMRIMMVRYVKGHSWYCLHWYFLFI